MRRVHFFCKKAGGIGIRRFDTAGEEVDGANAMFRPGVQRQMRLGNQYQSSNPLRFKLMKMDVQDLNSDELAKLKAPLLKDLGAIELLRLDTAEPEHEMICEMHGCQSTFPCPPR
jgi:hypothetical protein